MSADKKLPSVFSAFLVNMSAKQSDPINPKTKLRHQVLNYCGYSSQMKNIFCGAENSDKIKHRHFSSVRVSAAGNLWMFIFKMFAVETVISPLLWTPSWIPLCFWFYCRGRLTDPGTYQYAAQILLFPVRGKKEAVTICFCIWQQSWQKPCRLKHTFAFHISQNLKISTCRPHWMALSPVSYVTSYCLSGWKRYPAHIELQPCNSPCNGSDRDETWTRWFWWKCTDSFVCAEVVWCGAGKWNKHILTRSLTRMAEHCSGTPIILWGFQVTELALQRYWNSKHSSVRVWKCVCVCLWSLVVKGKTTPTLSRFECNNFACLHFEIWSLQSVAGAENRLHSWLKTKIQIFQFPLWPKKHTLLKTLISTKWCLLVSLKLLMCLSGFAYLCSMQLLSNFPKKQIKNTSWMPDSASFDKFWNIFQNLCLFFLGLALFLHLIETGMFKILNDRTYNTQKKKEKDIWAVLRLCTSLFSLSVNLITFITIYATHLYVPVYSGLLVFSEKLKVT